MANPWNIVSIYELQYFNCPSCNFKNHCKQEIVTHAYECHPESINFLTKISDDSLNDVIFPWNNLIIKEENCFSFSVFLLKNDYLSAESMRVNHSKPICRSF